MSKFEYVLGGGGCAERLEDGGNPGSCTGGGGQSPVQSRGGALYIRVAGLGSCTGTPLDRQTDRIENITFATPLTSDKKFSAD